MYGVHIEQSIMHHPEAGKECFANQAFSDNEIIGFYYGTLIFENTFYVSHSRENYEEGNVSATDFIFCIRTIYIESEVLFYDGQVH